MTSKRCAASFFWVRAPEVSKRGGVQSYCEFVEVEYADRFGDQLIVTIPPEAARRVIEYCRRRNWNVGRFYRDTFGAALRAVLVFNVDPATGECMEPAGDAGGVAPELPHPGAIGTVQAESESDWLQLQGIGRADPALRR